MNTEPKNLLQQQSYALSVDNETLMECDGHPNDDQNLSKDKHDKCEDNMLTNTNEIQTAVNILKFPVEMVEKSSSVHDSEKAGGTNFNIDEISTIDNATKPAEGNQADHADKKEDSDEFIQSIAKLIMRHKESVVLSNDYHCHVGNEDCVKNITNGECTTDPDNENCRKIQDNNSTDQIPTVNDVHCLDDVDFIAVTSLQWDAEAKAAKSWRPRMPFGWKAIRHKSGIRIYVHMNTNIVTLSRPYSIEQGTSSEHFIPACAIPCLAYKRDIGMNENLSVGEPCLKRLKLDEAEVRDSEIYNPDEKSTIDNNLIYTDENEKVQNQSITLTPTEVTDYCKSLFKFRTFQQTKYRRTERKVASDTTECSKTQIVIPYTKPSPGKSKESKDDKYEYILDPIGKSPVSILHHYTQAVLHTQPLYKFGCLKGDVKTATVFISNAECGKGSGWNKQEAKNFAAKRTLEVFLPELQETLALWEAGQHKHKDEKNISNNLLEPFDNLDFDDPHIYTLCQSLKELPPYSLLLKCIQKNFGKESLLREEVNLQSTNGTEKKIKLSVANCVVDLTIGKDMKVKHGKQVAAQMLLKKLHPDVENFGIFLERYGTKSNEEARRSTKLKK